MLCCARLGIKIMTMRLIDNGEMEITFEAINFISIRNASSVRYFIK